MILCQACKRYSRSEGRCPFCSTRSSLPTGVALAAAAAVSSVMACTPNPAYGGPPAPLRPDVESPETNTRMEAPDARGVDASVGQLPTHAEPQATRDAGQPPQPTPRLVNADAGLKVNPMGMAAAYGAPPIPNGPDSLTKPKK